MHQYQHQHQTLVLGFSKFAGKCILRILYLNKAIMEMEADDGCRHASLSCDRRPYRGPNGGECLWAGIGVIFGCQMRFTGHHRQEQQHGS